MPGWVDQISESSFRVAPSLCQSPGSGQPATGFEHGRLNGPGTTLTGRGVTITIRVPAGPVAHGYSCACRMRHLLLCLQHAELSTKQPVTEAGIIRQDY